MRELGHSRTQLSLDAMPSLFGHGQGIFENGSDQVRDRHPQVVGEAFELLFEYRRHAGVNHPLVNHPLLVRWSLY